MTETPKVLLRGSSQQCDFFTSLCFWAVTWTWESCLERENFTAT